MKNINAVKLGSKGGIATKNVISTYRQKFYRGALGGLAGALGRKQLTQEQYNEKRAKLDEEYKDVLEEKLSTV